MSQTHNPFSVQNAMEMLIRVIEAEHKMEIAAADEDTEEVEKFHQAVLEHKREIRRLLNISCQEFREKLENGQIKRPH